MQSFTGEKNHQTVISTILENENCEIPLFYCKYKIIFSKILPIISNNIS